MGDNGTMQVSLSSNFSRLSPLSPNDPSNAAGERPADAQPNNQSDTHPDVLPDPQNDMRSQVQDADQIDSLNDSPHHELLNALVEEAIAAYTPVPPQASADSTAMRRTLHEMLAWAQTLDQAGERPAERLQILGTGMRSIVVRVEFNAAPNLPTSMIMKRYRCKDSTQNAGGLGYLRERYGLLALNKQVPGLFPTFYGADTELRVIAIEDVSAGTADGEQYSVAHALLEGSEEQALQAMGYYVQAYSSMARAGIMGEAVETYRTNLARADRKAQYPGAIASPALAERGLKRIYGVEEPTEAEDTGEKERPRVHPVVEELTFRFRRVVHPFFTKRPPIPEQFKLNRGRVYMLSSGDFSPQNMLIGGEDAQVRIVDAEGTCLHHRGFPFVEAMLGFPSSPEYPRYRVDRERTLPALYSVLFEDAPLDTHLAEDLAVCTAVTVCALVELYSTSPRAALLPAIRREGAQLIRLLLQISGSQDAALTECADRMGAAD